MIKGNSNYNYIRELYLTIWNMCYKNKLTEVGTDEIHLMNIQDFPDLIPKKLTPISEVEELYLGEYPNLSLFPKIQEFKNLKKLELIENNLGRFPLEFVKFERLEDLSLTDDRIVEMPGKAGEMTSLKRLSLSACKLKSVNQCILKLVNLEELDLSFNELMTYPSWITDVPNLKKLNLYGTKISKAEIPNVDRNRLEIII